MIVGEKVILRWPKKEDAEWLFKNVTSPEVKSMLSNAHLDTMTIEKEKKWVKSQANNRRKKKEINFIILDKKTGDLAGACGFNMINSSLKYGIIGFWVAKKFWGRGFATEVTRLLIRYGFETLKLNRIEAECLTINKGSIKAQERAGLKREGLLKERARYKGKPYDEYINAILKKEWRKKI